MTGCGCIYFVCFSFPLHLFVAYLHGGSWCTVNGSVGSVSIITVLAISSLKITMFTVRSGVVRCARLWVLFFSIHTPAIAHSASWNGKRANKQIGQLGGFWRRGAMHIHETIPVAIVDPAEPNAAPIRRHIEDRTLFAYRNMGFALTHYHSSFTGANRHPIVIENMNQLRVYHRREYTYNLLLRRTYNVKTFQTVLGIIADSREPFNNVNQLQNTKLYAYRNTSADQEVVHRFSKEAVGGSYTPPQYMRFDALITGPHASAFITSCDSITEEFVINFVRAGHYTYYLHQHLSNPRYLPAWEKIYGPRGSRPAKPVLFYIGVGPQEFPESSMSAGMQRSLHAMVERCVDCVETPPPGIAADLIPFSVRETARKYGVRLLQRWRMRYFALRC
ncbi:hypothetical protein, conserved [Trypanosoma brucei brucei TREU927]|uniref:Uncharacterized protein n=1 Tax=Trypanosoma brucei brucei (strain 927/4 GUTat10.1) TaxID=185431 RepID=Q38A98_TRYB2|nr:hypothetical protein, conserved [Trypanosoma brucei brucei TREU927]EAN78272.1 hypothetical protein, conserved [Trypanosoma brucei brucei TREU927]